MKSPARSPYPGSAALVGVLLIGVHQLLAAEKTTLVPQAPPPPPAIETNLGSGATVVRFGLPTAYSIGQPTDEEQLYLEYINRSRANPTAEGVRLAVTTDPDVLSAYSYFGVDLALMQYEFSTNPVVAPLAMNAQLLAAARAHSADMFTNSYQSHTGTDGSSPGTRVTAQGYTGNIVGENIYSYAKSVFYGHAGLNVDWGPGTGGMQTPPGHRNNIHYSGFREIGVGVVDGINGSVGPQLVTQDLAAKSSPSPFITGVVYYDFNGSGFYDVGEGIGGVTVSVSNASYYAVTANSGGFAVPVTTNGIYTVVFAGPGITATQRLATVTAQQNVKLDYLPLYSPPVISGPNPASLNQSNLYSYTLVGGATNYQCEQALLASYTAIEGAENGLANVSAIISPGYWPLASDLKASGSYSFHLAQPDGTDQYLTLNPTLRLGTNSQLAFAKRLTWAASAQVARAQVSTNGGANWKDLWSQAGNDSSGDSSFSRITNSLSGYANQIVQFRFMYDLTGGSYYYQTNAVGFYVDDISVSGAEQLLNQSTNDTPGGASFSFVPGTATNYLLLVRAQLLGRTLNWGPAMRITTALPAPVIQFAANPALSGSQLQLDFTVNNYRSGMSFQLWKASDPRGPFSVDTSAAFSTLIPNSKFRATASTAGASKAFYKVKGTY